MRKLVLHSTDTSQWHALVSEAQAHANIRLGESSESYLVFLLMRFTQKPQFVESIIALEFLEAIQVCGRVQANRLSEVGDKSLLLCGLFPGLATKRCVQPDYFSAMGQAAYLTASVSHGSQLAALYSQLGGEFKLMQQVLQTMRSDCIRFAREGSSILCSYGTTLQ